MQINRIVADNVRGFRHKLDVSQEKLAEYADLHRNYIGYIEREERNVTLGGIAKLAKALKVKPYVLFIENAHRLAEKELAELNSFQVRKH